MATPLIEAVNAGNLATVKQLVERGADVNQGFKGETPLSIAIREGEQEIINFLLENGADPNGPKSAVSVSGSVSR